MSDIVMHPLTALNGSPEYTADDYRHAVNPWVSVSDGSAFNCVSGVRFGSPVPLATISGLTVTVKPHCGIVSPWEGVGAYTYALKNPVSVKVPDSTGDYKIVVAAYDPSLSHGEAPGAWLQSWPASTPNSEINGLVVARVTAGVVSDVAPRLRADGRVEVLELGHLTPIVTMNGVEAVVKNTGDRYRRVNGAWVPLTNIKLNPGQWAKDWNVSYKCSMVENVVNVYLRVSRKTEWVSKAWDRSQILTFPDYLKPKLSDINIPAAGVENSGFQLDPTGLYVRPFRDVTYTAGGWNTAAFSYSV
jgi:hypothetical protein